jgi:uncharacterized protein YjiS (DUF1127 family)
MLNFFKRILKKIEENQQKRAAFFMLQKYTDRELHDIGIGRSQIREIIYGKNTDGEATKVS